MVTYKFSQWIKNIPADSGRTDPHVHFWVFIPVFLLELSGAIYLGGLTLGKGCALFVAGLIFWTFMEYVLHRFSFHSTSEHPLVRPFNSGLHLLHHQQPSAEKYVAAPIVFTLVLYLVFMAGFKLVLGDLASTLMMGAGLVLSFLLYEYTHYSTHQKPATNAIARYLKRHHMNHHFVDQTRLFGVTSPFWDLVFGTLLPPKQTARKSAATQPSASAK